MNCKTCGGSGHGGSGPVANYSKPCPDCNGTGKAKPDTDIGNFKPLPWKDPQPDQSGKQPLVQVSITPQAWEIVHYWAMEDDITISDGILRHSDPPAHEHTFVVAVEWVYFKDGMFTTSKRVTKLRCNGCDAEVTR